MAKQAASAYWLWFEESRTSLVNHYGLEGKRATEVSQKASEVWKAMSHAEKQTYEDLAAKDKHRYEQDIQTLGKRVRTATVDNCTGKKTKRDMGAPKQPLSAFFIWVRDSREKAKKNMLGHVAAKDFSAEAWHAVSKANRKSYEDKAALAKEQYKKDLELYHLRRASLMSGREDSFMYSHLWNIPGSSRGHDGEAQDSDVCECGEKLNGVKICKQCGAESPKHNSTTIPVYIESIDTDYAQTTSDGSPERPFQNRPMATKEEILHMVGDLEKEEIMWLCQKMAVMTEVATMASVSRVDN